MICYDNQGTSPRNIFFTRYSEISKLHLAIGLVPQNTFHKKEGYVSKRAEINSLAEYIQAQVILFIALSRNKMPEDKQEKIMKLVIKTVTLPH